MGAREPAAGARPGAVLVPTLATSRVGGERSGVHLPNRAGALGRPQYPGTSSGRAQLLKEDAVRPDPP